MLISPKIGMWLSIAAAIISALMLCGAEFTTLFGDISTAKILAALGIFNAISLGANAILHAIPASQPNTTAQANQFPLGPTAKS